MPALVVAALHSLHARHVSIMHGCRAHDCALSDLQYWWCGTLSAWVLAQETNTACACPCSLPWHLTAHAATHDGWNHKQLLDMARQKEDTLEYMFKEVRAMLAAGHRNLPWCLLYSALVLLNVSYACCT